MFIRYSTTDWLSCLLKTEVKLCTPWIPGHYTCTPVVLPMRLGFDLQSPMLWVHEAFSSWYNTTLTLSFILCDIYCCALWYSYFHLMTMVMTFLILANRKFQSRARQPEWRGGVMRNLLIVWNFSSNISDQKKSIHFICKDSFLHSMMLPSSLFLSIHHCSSQSLSACEFQFGEERPSDH